MENQRDLAIKLLDMMLSKTKVKLTPEGFENIFEDNFTEGDEDKEYTIIRITEDINVDLYDSEKDEVLHDVPISDILNFTINK
jgi:hypothetical protein